MAEESQRESKKARPSSRAGLKTMSVIVAVLALVGSAISLLVVYTDDMARSFCETPKPYAEGDAKDYYERMSTSRSPRSVAELLMTDAMRGIEPEPFIESAPWTSLRLSMALRLLSYGAVLLGCILTIANRRLGPRLIYCASLCLVGHGFWEAATLYGDGQFLIHEFYRDLKISYSNLVHEVGLEQEFVGPFTDFRARGPEEQRFFVGAYFFIMTVLWQISALSLGGCRPIENDEAQDQEPPAESEELIVA